MDFLAFFAGFAALGWMTLTALGVFLVLLVWGTSLDRTYHNEAPKWWVLGLGLAFFFAYAYSTTSLTFGSLWVAFTSWQLWAPLGTYLLLGLIYSVPEFLVDIRRAARYYADEWQSFITKRYSEDEYVINPQGYKSYLQDPNTGERTKIKKTYAEVLQEAQRDELQGLDRTQDVVAAKEITSEFVGQYRFQDRIVELKTKTVGFGVEPRINKVELAEHIAAWVILWPAYLLSLILGDFLTELFKAIAEFFVQLSGRFVRMTFANVFKF